MPAGAGGLATARLWDPAYRLSDMPNEPTPPDGRSRASPQRRDADPSRGGDRARDRSPRRGDRPARRLRPRAVGRRRRGDLGAQPVRPGLAGLATPDDPTRPAETATARPTDSPTPEPTATPRPPEPSPAPTAPPAPKPPVVAGTTGRVHAHALQRRLDAWRAKHLVPGVSVAMLWDDGRIVARRLGERRRRARPAGHAGHRLRPRLDLQDLHGGRRPAARRRGQAQARRAGGAPPARVRHRSPGHGQDAARPHQRHQRLLLQPEDRPRAAVQPGRHVDRQAHVALRAAGAHPTRARPGATPTRTTCCWASS